MNGPIFEHDFDELVNHVSSLRIKNEYYCFTTIRLNDSRYLCVQLDSNQRISKNLTKLIEIYK